MDREERRRAFGKFLLAIEPIRAAHLEWRAAYEAEAGAVFGALEYETRMKLVFADASDEFREGGGEEAAARLELQAARLDS